MPDNAVIAPERDITHGNSNVTEHMIQGVYRLSLAGMKNAQIIETIGLGQTQFYDHVKNNPAFSEALRAGRGEVTGFVTESLLSRAMGTATETVTKTGPDGKLVGIQVKQALPDPAAALAILRAKAPDVWKEKTEVTHDIGGSFNEWIAGRKEGD